MSKLTNMIVYSLIIFLKLKLIFKFYFYYNFLNVDLFTNIKKCNYEFKIKIQNKLIFVNS